MFQQHQIIAPKILLGTDSTCNNNIQLTTVEIVPLDVLGDSFRAMHFLPTKGNICLLLLSKFNNYKAFEIA